MTPQPGKQHDLHGSAPDTHHTALLLIDVINDFEFPRGLRDLHITVRKVCGIKDESDTLIRLADSLAGFVRDYLEGEPYAQELYRQLHLERVIKKLP